jgi:phenylacetate-coenzyme A ligase PaaK-like adenylate-forming protein
MLSLPEIAGYQVEVDARGPMSELNLRIEPTAIANGDSELAGRVQSKFRAAFNLRVPVIVCPPGTLPRGEMKSQRWVRTNSAAEK